MSTAIEDSESPRDCAYCGLPAGSSRADGRPVYCCFGCRVAAEIQDAADGPAPDHSLLVRLGLAVFFGMNVMAFTMTLWTGEVYGNSPAADAPLESSLQGVFRWLTLGFSMPVYYLLGWPLAENAWANLRRRVFSTDLLLLLGVASAFAISLPAVVRDRGPVYFEVGVAVLIFVTLGRLLEARCKQRATRSLDALETLLPRNVDCEADGRVVVKPLAEIRPGDLAIVRAGQRIPCDGVIERSGATLDEQLWTGEAGGRIHSPGDPVRAGSLNLASDLFLRVESASHEGSLARLVEQIQRARHTRGRYERLADRMSRLFLPIVAVVAVGTAWVHGSRDGLDHGILSGLAVVLIACPCALGIATPLAIWAALGSAARRGVLFRNGDIIERMASLRAIAFDKTGTLTQGESVVSDARFDDESGIPRTLAVARAIASSSHHSLARTVVSYADRFDTETLALPSVTTHAGLGLEACGDDFGVGTVLLGSPAFLQRRNASMGPAMQEALDAALAAGQPVTGLAWNGTVRAWFQIAETLRPEAAVAIADLRRRGLYTQILTGDHRRRGELISKTLDTPVDAELLPGDKWRRLSAIRDRYGPVAMVGDGINDAPALAGADVGIAMGCGADVARASAGVCLLGDDLSQIVWAFDLAKRTVATIRLNLFWSIAYNVVGIGLACTGRLNPVAASLIMVVSSLLVVVSSSRLAPSDTGDRVEASDGVFLDESEKARLRVSAASRPAARTG